MEENSRREVKLNFFRVSESEVTRDKITKIGGLCATDDIKPGELAVSRNVVCDYYPFLRNAFPDVKLKKTDGTYCGLIMSDKLFECVSRSAVCKAYWGGVDTGLALSVGKKRLCRMGTKIIIFPDKMFYDTQTGESGSLEATFKSAAGVGVSSHLCDIDGNLLTADFSPTAPQNPAVGSYWCDTSVSPYTVKLRADSIWIEVTSVYMKITCPNIGASFKAGDGVGVAFGEDEAEYYVLCDVGSDYIIIPAVFEPSNLMGTVTVTRLLPETDFEIECKNRIWACRWGLNRNGVFVNEIYASKLGDPTNFYCYEGLSSDSYTVSLGSEGKFTGACVYLGNPIFFKEGSIHKIYGAKPSEFSLVTANAEGVSDGCSASLVPSEDMLYYVSREGFCAYDGAFPTVISKKIGEPFFTDAACAVYAHTLYLSAKCDGEYKTYVLNTRNGLWSERDYISVRCAAAVGDALFVGEDDKLYLLGAKNERKAPLAALCAGTVCEAEKPKWVFETGNLCGEDGEYIYKVAFRIKVGQNSTVKVSAQYRSGGEFESVGTVRSTVERDFNIPVLTHKTGSFRLRFEGEGDFFLYSIGKYSNKGIPSCNFRF